MLNTSFPSIYKKIEEMYLNDPEFSDEVVFTLSENTYREEVLLLFGLEEFDETLINDSISELYEKLKDNKDMKKILEFLKNEFDEDIVFHILFSYDYFHLFLPLIDNLLNNRDVEINFIK